MSFPTVRKFYRNSTEAFPNTTEYACAVEVFGDNTHRTDKVAKVIFAIAIPLCMYLVFNSLMVIFK